MSFLCVIPLYHSSISFNILYIITKLEQNIQAILDHNQSMS